MTIRGIDSDNYDGVIPESHFRLLHDRYDVKFDIIGLEAQMPYVKAQRDAALAAGIDVPFGYKFLYWSPNDLDRIKQAAETFGQPVAIDCEATTNLQPQEVVNRIQQAKEALQALGLYWGIYTGAWWWPSNTNNSTQFSQDKLWHAAYPFGNGVLPPQDYLPNNFTINYGGWNHIEVFQYADVCYGDELGPWALDMNAYEGSPIPTPIPPPAPPIRIFLYGNEEAGRERRGHQQVEWNNYVEIDKYGDEAGLFPGRHEHNVGGTWIQILP